MEHVRGAHRSGNASCPTAMMASVRKSGTDIAACQQRSTCPRAAEAILVRKVERWRSGLPASNRARRDGRVELSMVPSALSWLRPRGGGQGGADLRGGTPCRTGRLGCLADGAERRRWMPRAMPPSIRQRNAHVELIDTPPSQDGPQVSCRHASPHHRACSPALLCRFLPSGYIQRIQGASPLPGLKDSGIPADGHSFLAVPDGCAGRQGIRARARLALGAGADPHASSPRCVRERSIGALHVHAVRHFS